MHCETTFTAHVPGKVLLLGEHAVVHGHPAIATALSSGTTATVAGSDSPRLTLLDTPTISVEPHDDHPVARAFHAILQQLPEHARNGHVAVRSELPRGAGLGSSAALCAATATVLARAGRVNPPRDELLRIALAGEQVFHGNASGLDPAICIHGGLQRFVRHPKPRLEPIPLARPLTLVVAQVAPGANTRELVEHVRQSLHDNPDRTRKTLEGIHTLVDQAHSALTLGDLPTLGLLLNRNHALLQELGVSTPTLDEACTIAIRSGALGAKLTGAGGGGSIVALATPESLQDVAEALAPRATHLLRETIAPTA